jgi:hypothetical protein
MHVDRALRTALRNFSTFFLIVALVTVTLNLLWGVFFQDVLATRDIHADIQDLPAGEMVRGVDGAAIERARYGALIVLALEAALLPLMLRATRRATEADEAGRVPTALGSWRAVTRKRNSESGGRQLSVVVAMTVFAVVVWLLASVIGNLIAVAVSDRIAWLVVAGVRGLALALALPFALVGIVESQIERTPSADSPRRDRPHNGP